MILLRDSISSSFFSFRNREIKNERLKEEEQGRGCLSCLLLLLLLFSFQTSFDFFAVGFPEPQAERRDVEGKEKKQKSE